MSEIAKSGDEQVTSVVANNSNDELGVTRTGQFVSSLITKAKQEFIAVNPGFDLDFVHYATWLMIDGKGNFYNKDTEESYGDSIDIVIGQGEDRYTVWGEQGSEFDGKLICAERTEELAMQRLDEFNASEGSNFGRDDISERYLMSVVFVDAIAAGEAEPFVLSLAPTSRISFGKYAMSMFKGKFKDRGIKAGTPIAEVVHRLSTEEKKRDAKTRYTIVTFDAVEKFVIPNL